MFKVRGCDSNKTLKLKPGGNDLLQLLLSTITMSTVSFQTSDSFLRKRKNHICLHEAGAASVNEYMIHTLSVDRNSLLSVTHFNFYPPVSLYGKTEQQLSGVDGVADCICG